MKVALVNPNDAECYAMSRARARRFPLGQAYVAAALLRAGHDVSAVDASAEGLSEDGVLDRLRGLGDLDFVGIGGTTPLWSQMVRLTRGAQALGAKVILGGPHVSALPGPSAETSGADFVCVGEGEETVVAVVEGREPPAKPYRTKVSQRAADTVKAIDLDACPIPARYLYDHSRYVDPARGVESAQTGAMFSRGCPGKCAFCGAADTLVRWRNLDNVLEELHQVEAAGIPNVFVMDDTYTSQRRRVLNLSRRIVEEGVRLRLGVQLRLDQVDEEVCDALYASGVRHVGPGIESGSERVMRAIGKGPRESKAHAREKVALLKRYDWLVRCSYVFGMPGETEAEMLETIEFAKELGADESAFSILTPYPDSPLWAVALERGLVDPYMDFDRFLYYHSVGCNLSAVPTERLLELHELAYRETAR